MSVLEIPVVSRIRRNHGLEHATMHVLLQRDPRLSLIGRSDWGGFSIYGEVNTAQLESAAREALARLRAGESDLAVHPRCGTMLTTTGLLSGMAAFVAVGLGRARSRDRWSYLPETLLAATLGAIAAQPLGFLVQQYVTTSGDVRDMEITRVTRQGSGRVPVHRVETR
jgi:hypothetical protein